MNVKHLLLPIGAAVAWLGLGLLAAQAADAQAEVTVNGSQVDLSPPPIVRDGRVFVPLRGVFEQLGASVDYANGTITATGNGRDIFLQIGSTQATVNDAAQTIDVAPFIVGASTYVPLRFVSEALGDSVNWDDADRIAQIDTGGGSATYYSPGTASYVDTAPPAIPVYDQPEVPAPNYIWQPGYWAWGAYGYYWVPGTWVAAPQPGYLWTPGYWEWNNYGYVWLPGYWATSVGFYGGVDYGSGYYGRGYDGGRWNDNVFAYNTFVTRVNVTVVRNVYIDRTVYVDNATTRISYNGGRGGVRARPTTSELAVATSHHLGMTVVQQQHVKAAEQDRRLLAKVNHNKPPVLAVARPLSRANPSVGLEPVKPVERVNPLANVAPVRVPVAHAAPARAAAPAAAAAPHVAAPVAHAPPAVHVPIAAKAPVVHVPPAVAAPAPVAHAAPAPVAHAAPAPVVHAAPAVHAAPLVHVAPAAPPAPPVRAVAPVHAPGANAGPPAHVPAHAVAAPHAPPAHPAPPAQPAPKPAKTPG